MDCKPKPEAFCGNLIPDTCVPVTILWPSCFPGKNDCPRQSEFNQATADLICCLDFNALSVLKSINGDKEATICTSKNNSVPLTGCVGITPSNKMVGGVFQVHEEFQAVYDALCSLQTNLNIPLVGLNLQCLQDPCGVPIGTLGQLLQALINAECDAAGTPKVYRATLTQSGAFPGNPPVATILENSLGNIVWSHDGDGIYGANLTNAFTANKTFVLIGQVDDIAKNIRVQMVSNGLINVKTWNMVIPANGILTQVAIEIRVYP